MATTKVIQHDGEIWVEQQIFIVAIQANSEQKGRIEALEAEIKHLREIAGSVSILAAKIQDMGAGLQRAQEKREKPLLQIGWYNSPSRRFCYTDEKEHNPAARADYTVPVYAIYT